MRIATHTSPFVVPLNLTSALPLPLAAALCSVSVTGIEAAGRPSVVSSTWQVMGGFFSVAMVALLADVAPLNCFPRASMRCVAVGEEAGIRDGRMSECWSWS